MTTRLGLAHTAADFAAFRALMAKYIAWMKHTYADLAHRVDEQFAPLRDELDRLPGSYGAPDGCLLLAWHHGIVVGSVGYRRIDDEACELKTMFVDPELHGTGLGRSLAEDAIRRARDAGYRRIQLVTGARQHAALALYERLRFQPMEPYLPVPAEVRGLARFLQLHL